MEVKIINFNKIKVALIEHRGSQEDEYNTVNKLIKWKIENKLFDANKYRNYGLHYTNPKNTEKYKNKVDFCLSIDFDVIENEYGIKDGSIPNLRCALARDIGSRSNNKAIVYLTEEWLPRSGERIANFPIIFHYVNVGPNVKPEEMVTDVYLPLA
ncbi:MAG: AraC family transcriptional regulator [Pseudohongiellaceae bacterium]